MLSTLEFGKAENGINLQINFNPRSDNETVSIFLNDALFQMPVSAAPSSPSPLSRTSPDEEMYDLPSYPSVAALFAVRAVQLEVDGSLAASLECYRAAIGTLFESAQADRSLESQASGKKRIAAKETGIAVNR